MAGESRDRERDVLRGRAQPQELVRWLGVAGPAYPVLIVVGDDIIAGESPGLAAVG